MREGFPSAVSVDFQSFHSSCPFQAGQMREGIRKSGTIYKDLYRSFTYG